MENGGLWGSAALANNIDMYGQRGEGVNDQIELWTRREEDVG